MTNLKDFARETGNLPSAAKSPLDLTAGGQRRLAEDSRGDGTEVPMGR
jgi:hypothetical protein